MIEGAGMTFAAATERDLLARAKREGASFTASPPTPAGSVTSAASRPSRGEPSLHTRELVDASRGPQIGSYGLTRSESGSSADYRKAPPMRFPSEHCTGGCTEIRHSKTCLSRRRRARKKAALREQPDQNIPAYLSDELGLSEEEKVGVELIAKTPIKDEDGNVVGILGCPSMAELLRSVERRQRAALTDGKSIPKGYEWDGILETAWALPLWQYRRIEEAIQRASNEGRR